MNPTLIMRAAAVVSAVFGLALLLVPNTVMDLYQAEPLNGPGIYNTMLYGGALLGLAVMNWIAADGNAVEARDVVLGTYIFMIIGLVVALYRQFTDQSVPPAAWLNVAIFFVFTALYGYLQFGHLPTGRPAATA
jgi:hypothetical protein